MPSKDRYARERAKLAAKGSTPYAERVRSVRRRAPGTSTQAARGHGVEGARLASRRPLEERARDRERRGRSLGKWCAVCGSAIEPPRPGSLLDRTCDREQYRRWVEAGRPNEPGSMMAGLRRLAADEGWVSARRAESRAAGVPLRRPRPGALR